MIIGNGDIATVLRDVDRHDRLYFVSGVSNSSETRESEFKRERVLLADTVNRNRGTHLVYVSSLAVFYSDTPYAEHKRTMERLVKKFSALRAILRVGNITWGSNPNTLINFLRGQKERGERLDIQDTQRYVIDKDEFLYWVGMIPPWSCEMNITGKRMTIAEIVREYVEPYAVREWELVA